MVVALGSTISLAGLYTVNSNPSGAQHEWSSTFGPTSGSMQGVIGAMWQEVSSGSTSVRMKLGTTGSSWLAPVIWNGAQTITLAPWSQLLLGDPYVAWDAANSRFIFVVLAIGSGDSQVWFGTISPAGQITVRSSPVMDFQGAGYRWDYPSISVKPNGHIVIGAVRQPSAVQSNPTLYRFHISTSSDGGSTFSSPVEPNSLASQHGIWNYIGPQSRVTATTSHFNAFVPFLHPPGQIDAYGNLIGNLPYKIQWHRSIDGVSWTNMGDLLQYWTPRDQTNSAYCPQNQGGACLPVFTAPYLDARSAGERWVVSFPVGNGTGNNIVTCSNEASPPACGALDWRTNTDQLLQSSSAATNFDDPNQRQDYWHAYYTQHPSLSQRLVKRAFYQSPGGGWPPAMYTLQNAAQSYSAPILEISMDSWRISNGPWPTDAKCAGLAYGLYTTCYDGGDYGQTASTRGQQAMMYYSLPVNGNHLGGAWLLDPPGPVREVPNALRFAPGADLRNLFPLARGPRTGGLSPSELAATKANLIRGRDQR